ncbi:MAG: Ig-like domain-containing protein, partial [Bacteroidales bacterium]|nr:Ig-like domain-containing protein [Bacteroidales bacterium]
MKICARIITVIAIAFLLVGCANVVMPSGGPKDTKSPVVLEASPANNSTGFTGKTIHLTFDEFVTLNNPTNNVLISPPVSKKPTYRTSGKTLIIKFEEPLQPNTTYSINFGDAIKDLHEGNIFKGYTFNFSTGASIDSLSLKGKVISASALTPMDGMIVGLYSDDNESVTLDSLPYKVKPNYITTTDKQGVFEFSGLADKDYLVFALKDANSNLIYDLPNEEIAFCTDLIKPYYIDNQIITKPVIDTIKNDSIATNDSILISVDSVFDVKKPDYPSYVLYSFIQEDSVQKLFKKELVEEGLLRFVFRYPASNVSINALESLPDTFNITPVYSMRQDTILWYFTPCKDSLWISINDGVKISDTTHFSLKPRENVSRRRRRQDEN